MLELGFTAGVLMSIGVIVWVDGSHIVGGIFLAITIIMLILGVESDMEGKR